MLDDILLDFLYTFVSGFQVFHHHRYQVFQEVVRCVQVALSRQNRSPVLKFIRCDLWMCDNFEADIQIKNIYKISIKGLTLLEVLNQNEVYILKNLLYFLLKRLFR